MSGFLDEKYGFLPLVIPITEPAVGYGAAGGIAFLGSSLGAAKTSYERPNITIVGGLGTENGTWGTLAGDMRHWLDNRLQTLCGVVVASVNLDFYGVGEDAALSDHPLRYNLEPKGGALQGKLRLGDSRFFAGASYAFVSTDVSFDSPPGTSGLPEFSEDSDVGGISPSLTFDSRNNIFTPIRGAYVEASMGVFSRVLGSDDEFQRARIIGMQFFALPRRPLFFGYRGELAASFGDAPFYLEPFVFLRGAPILRYQGEEVAQFEVELRWQCWKRYSLVGFTGYGAAWNDFDLVNDSQSVVTGGTGVRYEIARSYGIHMGLDVAFGPETTAIYVQAGSAWARP
jgi:outer membrane protein assembly factor BamA